MAGRPASLLVDTDIFIDYLNGVQRAREILDSPRYIIYYSPVTRKELLRKPGLSTTELQRIRRLLLRHRVVPVDQRIARSFSRLMATFSARGLRNADALIAATAWARALPILTRNTKHYRFISEITVVDPSKLSAHSRSSRSS